MNTLTKKIATAIAAGSLLFHLATPALAATEIIISGNGSDSDNTATFNYTNKVNVTQRNNANILNNIKVDADTGHNDAEDNTGGDVGIETGDSTTTVSVSNTANSNTASVDSCCLTDVNAEISGNGTDSDNDLRLGLKNEANLLQGNNAVVINSVDVDADTGRNDAEDNTGGEVSIKTGNAEVGVGLSTTLNANSALISGDGGGSLAAIISGNGSDSDNDLDVDLKNEVNLTQGNRAFVLNDVYVDADTGRNDAEDNTGGDVEINTGDAEALVLVDNMANFNWADIDSCGCLEDILVKIAGNGSDSDNDLEVDITSGIAALQDNYFDCMGPVKDACADVELNLDTGENDAKDNTVGGDDPTIETGDAEGAVNVENTANSNFLSMDGSLELPNFEFEMDFEEAWSFFIGWLAAHVG